MKKQSVVIRFMQDCGPEGAVEWYDYEGYGPRNHGNLHPIWAETLYNFAPCQGIPGIHGYDQPFRFECSRADLNKHLKKFRVKMTVVPINTQESE